MNHDYPSTGRAWYTVAVLLIAYIFSFIDRQIRSLLVVPVRCDLGITHRHWCRDSHVRYSVAGAAIHRTSGPDTWWPTPEPPHRPTATRKCPRCQPSEH